jgi:hypothetical protein
MSALHHQTQIIRRIIIIVVELGDHRGKGALAKPVALGADQHLRTLQMVIADAGV